MSVVRGPIEEPEEPDLGQPKVILSEKVADLPDRMRKSPFFGEKLQKAGISNDNPGYVTLAQTIDGRPDGDMFSFRGFIHCPANMPLDTGTENIDGIDGRFEKITVDQANAFLDAILDDTEAQKDPAKALNEALIK